MDANGIFKVTQVSMQNSATKKLSVSFAPVVPLQIAKLLQERNCFGSYHLLLAHDVLDNPVEYAEVYANKGYTILMDNSLVELGYSMSVEFVAAAAQIVGAQYVILPDVLNEAQTTYELTLKALKEWHNLEDTLREGINLLAVVQGANLKDQQRLINRFTEHGEIGGVCIPRVIADTQGSRKWIIDYASLFYRMHLLGFSDFLIDDVACARMPGVIGIDSAVPIRLGLRNRRLSLDNPQDAGKRESYWGDPFKLSHDGDGPLGQSIRIDAVCDAIAAFRRAIAIAQ